MKQNKQKLWGWKTLKSCQCVVSVPQGNRTISTHTHTHPNIQTQTRHRQREGFIFVHCPLTEERPVLFLSTALLVVWEMSFSSDCLGLMKNKHLVNCPSSLLSCRPRSWRLLMVLLLFFLMPSPVSVRLTHSLPTSLALRLWNTDHLDSLPFHSAEGLIFMACLIY